MVPVPAAVMGERREALSVVDAIATAESSNVVLFVIERIVAAAGKGENNKET